MENSIYNKIIITDFTEIVFIYHWFYGNIRQVSPSLRKVFITDITELPFTVYLVMFKKSLSKLEVIFTFGAYLKNNNAWAKATSIEVVKPLWN